MVGLVETMLKLHGDGSPLPADSTQPTAGRPRWRS